MSAIAQASAAETLWEAIERVYRRIAPDGAQESPAHGEADGDRLDRLRDIFRMTQFELDVLVLCAGVAIDPRFSEVSPAFGFAMARLDGPHWSAMSRVRPLRHWRLVEMGHRPLLQASLTIDERILQYLLGVPASDDRLDALLRPMSLDEAGVEAEESDSLRSAAHAAAAHWRHRLLLITGGSADDRARLFGAVCRESGLRPFTLDASDVPAAPTEREHLARALTREARLSPMGLLVHTGKVDATRELEAWLARVDAPVAVEAAEGSPAESLSGVRVTAPAMTAGESKQLWQRELGFLAPELGDSLDGIVDTFAMDGGQVRETARMLRERAGLEPAFDVRASAWEMCRVAARRSLDELATRVESASGWSDLVLPEAETKVLRQIVAHAKHAAQVFGTWDFGGRHARGTGLSALFSGASGTGKTMAAGILARELDRDLYQIDLATVVSKYIGETEKHLRSIFNAAEKSGAILLFDEADSLFGKRGPTREALDRYANIEISYLLQRMETYRGIAILTTNMPHAIDQAFERRLRFIVHFPFPEPVSRERIWRGAFPSAAPTGPLDFARLAQLNVTGAVIRNIALHGAFLAADDGKVITMQHLLAATRTEYAKLDKPLSAAETRGWA